MRKTPSGGQKMLTAARIVMIKATAAKLLKQGCKGVSFVKYWIKHIVIFLSFEVLRQQK